MELNKRYNELIIPELASKDNPILSAKHREYLLNVLAFYEIQQETIENQKQEILRLVKLNKECLIANSDLYEENKHLKSIDIGD